MDDTDAIALSVSIDGKATVGVDSEAAEEEDDAPARVDRARAEGETAVGDEPRAAAKDDLITGLLPARRRHLVRSFSGPTPVSHAVF